MKTSQKITISPACGLILLQSLLYGFGDPISKEAYGVMPVCSLLSIRYLLALALLPDGASGKACGTALPGTGCRPACALPGATC